MGLRAQMKQERLLTLKQVISITGLSKSTIYNLRKKGEFPLEVIVSSRRIGWPEKDIMTWIKNRRSATHISWDNYTKVHREEELN